MRVMQIPIGVLKDGFHKTKEVWKLRKEKPQLFLFLTQLTYLGLKFRFIRENKFVFTEKELKNSVKKVGNFLFSLKSEMWGERRFLMTQNKNEQQKIIEEMRKSIKTIK